MIKIGITGSVSSGKSTFSKYLSKNKYPIFSADKAVKDLYKNKKFTKKLSVYFNLKNDRNIKGNIKKIIKSDSGKIRLLESLIHPEVRKKMKDISVLKKKSKIIIFEIPLLIESKLMKFFNITIFVSAPRSVRVSRYIKKGGCKKMFEILNNRQERPKKKAKLCDLVIFNNKTLKKLKIEATGIINQYE